MENTINENKANMENYKTLEKEIKEKIKKLKEYQSDLEKLKKIQKEITE